MKELLDPGFGESYNRSAKRMINPDGSFNIIRRLNGRPIKDLYQFLINTSWFSFLFWVILLYTVVNLVFACIYLLIGCEHLVFSGDLVHMNAFWRAFFFSAQTLTTVGYGHIAPDGVLTSFIASTEALVGLLLFALVTGVCYGRFSNPKAKIRFSKNALITEVNGIQKLMFRMANRNPSMLVDIEARVFVAFGEHRPEGFHRSYLELPLERSKVSFMPLNWTLVHDINHDSPLHHRKLEGLKPEELEIFVMIKGFDDTYSTVVHTRYSYASENLIFGKKYKKAFFIDNDGNAVLDLEALDDLVE